MCQGLEVGRAGAQGEVRSQRLLKAVLGVWPLLGGHWKPWKDSRRAVSWSDLNEEIYSDGCVVCRGSRVRPERKLWT